MQRGCAAASFFQVSILRRTLALPDHAGTTPVVVRRPQQHSYPYHDVGIRSSHNMAQDVMNHLAKRGKTWKRLSHLVDLASLVQKQQASSRNSSIVDIGTDHGMLALALAASSNVSVIGVDASPQALHNGALALQKEIHEYAKTTTATATFRCGNGFTVLEPGEADIVCMAGMGVNTMLQIMSGTTTKNTSHALEQLDRVQSRWLILQPTNSKPRNLIRLYRTLHSSAWSLQEERIQELNGRWYLTALFYKRPAFLSTKHGDALSREDDEFPLPGTELLAACNNHNDNQTFQNYVQHHCRWLEQLQDGDNESNRSFKNDNAFVNEDERDWLAQFKPLLDD